MKIYIATGGEHWSLARLIAARLEADGHVWTYDWTVHLVGDRPPTPSIEIAANERAAIEAADLLVCVLPGLKGTHWEAGYADGLRKPILLFGEPGLVRAKDGHASGCICPFYEGPRVNRFLWVADLSPEEKAAFVAGVLRQMGLTA